MPNVDKLNRLNGKGEKHGTIRAEFSNSYKAEKNLRNNYENS